MLRYCITGALPFLNIWSAIVWWRVGFESFVSPWDLRPRGLVVKVFELQLLCSVHLWSVHSAIDKVGFAHSSSNIRSCLANDESAGLLRTPSISLQIKSARNAG